MDTDETQIKTGDRNYSLRPIAEQLNGAAFEIHDVLGYLINFGRERLEYKRMVF
ncbi:MAG: hypothetical protein RLZZ350_1756 [Verrucomicrobiota bacterium]|jgi:hypothetical protein